MRLKRVLVSLALVTTFAVPAQIARAVTYEMPFPVIGDVHYTDTYGAPRGGGRTHDGIDIMGTRFLPVIAVAEGEVGWVADELGGDCCAVEIRHTDGWRSWYIHLNNDTPGTDDGNWFGLAAGVVEGAPVHEGQLIGWMGDSGNAEGATPHLHFELHDTSNNPVNPFPSLQAAGQLEEPVTLPEPPSCDFNGDGFGDAGVGAPGTPFGGTPVAGWVATFTGREGGITPGAAMAPDEEWGSAKWGSSFTCGDFNGDGLLDLAVGAPGADSSPGLSSGGVEILMSDGEVPNPTLWIDQDTSGVDGVAEDGDQFGAALAAGDFNGDGFDDLAIGSPGEAVGMLTTAGAITVIYGDGFGLVASTTQTFTQETAGLNGIGEPGDEFGSSLAAADFNRDGMDDLAIGAPGEGIGAADDAGSVHIIHGSSTGLTTTGDKDFNQDSAGVIGIAEAGDRLGGSLAAGDANQDGFDDLAVGVPGEGLGSESGAGSSLIFFGSTQKLRSLGSQAWDQNISGIMGIGETGDGWGSDLALADTDLDGYDDLAVGIPTEDVETIEDAGAVVIIRGSAKGLTASGDESWNQSLPGIAGAMEAGDRLGSYVRLVDLDGDGRADLLAAADGEDVVSEVDAGGLHLIRGADSGLTEIGSSVWNQSAFGGANQAGHRFGVV